MIVKRVSIKLDCIGKCRRDKLSTMTGGKPFEHLSMQQGHARDQTAADKAQIKPKCSPADPEVP